MPQNVVQGEYVGFFRNILFENDIEVAADPIVDLFDAFVGARSFEGDVYISDDGREGGRDLDPSWESSGHCVAADTLNKAGRFLLQLRGIWKRRGSSVKIGRGNHFE